MLVVLLFVRVPHMLINSHNKHHLRLVLEVLLVWKKVSGIDLKE